MNLCNYLSDQLWNEVMSKGRKLEKGLTHQLTSAEVDKIMRRFDGKPFQEQVVCDLRGTRYKLYDAVGMWLGSWQYVDEKTYRMIEEVAKSYLDESLVRGYFRGSSVHGELTVISDLLSF